MSPRAITILLLLLAVACYFAGLALPAAVFIVIGAVLELGFWVRLFTVDHRAKAGDG